MLRRRFLTLACVCGVFVALLVGFLRGDPTDDSAERGDGALRPLGDRRRHRI